MPSVPTLQPQVRARVRPSSLRSNQDYVHKPPMIGLQQRPEGASWPPPPPAQTQETQAGLPSGTQDTNRGQEEDSFLPLESQSPSYTRIRLGLSPILALAQPPIPHPTRIPSPASP